MPQPRVPGTHTHTCVQYTHTHVRTIHTHTLQLFNLRVILVLNYPVFSCPFLAAPAPAQAPAPAPAPAPALALAPAPAPATNLKTSKEISLYTFQINCHH